jgi:hypothetical protein
MALFALWFLLFFVPLLRSATPTIVVNNSTGSDTIASGAPSTFGPFSAAATCHTGGVLTNVITWAANPLAGVPTDSSAALWLNNGGGAHCPNGSTEGCMAAITARAAGTVTVDATFNIPAGTPVDCAVGGKRASISALSDTQTPKSGWEVQVQFTGVNYTRTTTIVLDDSTFPRIWIHGTGGTPTLEWTANVTGFSNARSLLLQNFTLLNSSAGNTSGALTGINGSFLRNLTFTGWGAGVVEGGAGPENILYQSEVKNGGDGVLNQNPGMLIVDNYIHGNSGQGIGGGRMRLLYNIVTSAAKGSIGINPLTSIHTTVDGFVACASYGTTNIGLVLSGNLFTNCTTGLSAPAGLANVSATLAAWMDDNAYFGNTTNYAATVTAIGPNDTVGVNPQYVNAAGANYGIGPPLQAKGFPLSSFATGSTTNTRTGTEPGAPQGLNGGAGGGGCCTVK